MTTTLSLALAVTIVAITACGGSGDGNTASTSPQTQSQTTPVKKQTAPFRPKPRYRDRVADCLNGRGYRTRDAGNALRVEVPGSKLISNVQIFGTVEAARAFARQLVVPHGYPDGRAVAIWLRDAERSEKAAVSDCLAP